MVKYTEHKISPHPYPYQHYPPYIFFENPSPLPTYLQVNRCWKYRFYMFLEMIHILMFIDRASITIFSLNLINLRKVSKLIENIPEVSSELQSCGVCTVTEIIWKKWSHLKVDDRLLGQMTNFNEYVGTLKTIEGSYQIGRII